MRISLFVAMLVSALLSGQSFAAVTTGITITGIGCDANGICFANISPAANVAGGSAACDNQAQVRWDGTSAEGKNYTASALTAKAAGLTVNIGTIDDDCFESNTSTTAFPLVNFITVAG